MSTWNEFLAKEKEKFWQLHKPGRSFFGLYTKRICPYCGKVFKCRNCELYPVCDSAIDWKWKEGCMCEDCYEKV